LTTSSTKGHSTGFYALMLLCILFGIIIAVSMVKFMMFVCFTILVVMYHYNIIGALPDISIINMIPDLIPPWMCMVFIILYIIARSSIIVEVPNLPR
jgi:hypothetical protein